MNLFRKILFATDFSGGAAHAEKYAFTFAARFGAALHVVHALDIDILSHAGARCCGFDVEKTINDIKNQAWHDLAAIVRKASKTRIANAQMQLAIGRPAEAIVDEAQRLECDLIVIGTHGRGAIGHALMGSVAERVVRLSPVPVLTIHPKERELIDGIGKITVKHVLCPCDLSPMADQAVAFAARICRSFGAELTLLHVLNGHFEYPLVLPDQFVLTAPEVRQHATNRLKALAANVVGTKVHYDVVSGIPNKTILDVARDRSMDLIAMTTHGYSGLPRTLLGSTVERVVRKAHLPMLTLRPVSQPHAMVVSPEAVSNALS